MNEGAQSLPPLPPITAVAFSHRKEVTCLSEQESGHGLCLMHALYFSHKSMHKKPALE